MDFRITKLERAPEGFWRAHVSNNGTTIDVDNRHGSWRALIRVPHTQRFTVENVNPAVAAALQRKLPREARQIRR